MALGAEAPELLALALPIAGMQEAGTTIAQKGAQRPPPPQALPGACMLLLTRHAHVSPSVLDFVMRARNHAKCSYWYLPLA